MSHKKLWKRLLSTALSIALMLQLLPSSVLAANESQAADEEENIITEKITFPYTQHDAETPARSLETLKALDSVTLDESGRVMSVDISSDDFTNEELRLLFGIENTVSTPAYETAGLTEDEFNRASELHGGDNIFISELIQLDLGLTYDSLDEDTYGDIKSLICSGYSYSQTKAALVSKDILGYSIDELSERNISKWIKAQHQQGLPGRSIGLLRLY